MKTTLLTDLNCPGCQGALEIDKNKVKPVTTDDNELREGLLTCKSCNKNYPVICGLAILLDKTNTWLRSNYYYLAEGALNSSGIGESLARYLDQQGWRMSASPANNYYELPRWVEIFLSTHYDPIPAGANDTSDLGQTIAGQPSVFDFVSDNLQQLKPGSGGRALDVGANVGGMTWRLAQQMDNVIAIDTAFNPMLTARKIQLGEPQPQTSIRRYIDGLRHEEIQIGPFPSNVEFLIASVFDLPINGQFDVVTALNVIDVVPNPNAFIEVLINRLESGGLLVITSPYSWGSDDVPIENWLGDKDTPSSEVLTTLLKDKGLTIEQEADCIPWVLREHKRWYRVFHNHCVIARKP